MVWAIVVIGGLSFVVWAHHMYVSGMNPYFGFFFATSTLIIAVPTAIKVYNWVLTLWRGNIHFTVPMLFAIAFIFTFINGGLTGLFLGNVSVDVPLSDTYFVVAHFHMVMGVSPILVIFGAIYHWYPKITGRMWTRRWASSTSGSRSSAPMRSSSRCIIWAFWACRGAITRWARPRSFRSRPISQRIHHDRRPDRGLRPADLLLQHDLEPVPRRRPGGNPWSATTLEWQTPDTPPAHGNWGPKLPVVYRWAYDYSVPGAPDDFIPQNEPPAARA